MTDDNGAKIIPFYGGEAASLFEIERRCMDRDGMVISHLDANLPLGLVLDIGAGNGFTAARLQRAHRTVVPCEPNWGMIGKARNLSFVRGVAQQLPFAPDSFDAAYATWAFFLRGVEGIEDGLAELSRVVRNDGRVVIIDNAGDDEFCSFASAEITADRDFWLDHGFTETVIETCWRFDDNDEARLLFRHFFGDVEVPAHKTNFSYRVSAFSKQVAEPSFECSQHESRDSLGSRQRRNRSGNRSIIEPNIADPLLH